MNAWEVAAVVLLVVTLPCGAVAAFASATAGLAAFEVASTLATTTLMVLSEGFHRQPFIDLALVLAMLSIVGGLAFARMMERDL
jgi:multisubunit Na+/H+ antiporter MnhF subunit